MVSRPTRFRPPSGLEALSPEARQLVIEANEHLARWIDQNVDRLEAEMQASVDTGRRALEAEVSALCEELAASRQQMTELLERLARLENGFSAGDGVTVERAARETRDTVEAVRSALAERERRVRELARAVAPTGSSGAADR